MEAKGLAQKETCGQGINNISTWRIRKEKLAYGRQKAEHIEKGLIWCMVMLGNGSSYQAVYYRKTGYPNCTRRPITQKTVSLVQSNAI